MDICINTGYDYKVPVMQSLGKVADAGFETVCFGMRHEHAGYHLAGARARLKARLREVGLRAHAIHAWSILTADAFADVDATAAAERDLVVCLEACEELGASILVVHPHVWGNPTPNVIDEEIRLLERLAVEAGERDVRIALENVSPDTAETHLIEMLQRLPADRVGFCFDSAHDDRSSQPLELLDQIGDRLVTVHLSDRSPKLGVEHLPPGDGHIQWAELTARLAPLDFGDVLFTEVGRGGCVDQYPEVPAYLETVYARGRWLAGMIEERRT